MQYIIKNKIFNIYVKSKKSTTFYIDDAFKGNNFECITIFNKLNNYFKRHYEIVELKEKQ